MKKAALVCLVFLVLAGIAFAQVETKAPPVEKEKPEPSPPGPEGSSEEACALWEAFKEKYGIGWQVRWNKYTQVPEKIFGYHYDMGMGEVTDEVKAVNIIEKFIADNKDSLKVNPSDLKLSRIVDGNGAWRVEYQQYYQGVPVKNSFVGVTITDKGEIYSASSGFHSGISISATPAISEDDAIEIAKRAVNVSIITKLGNVSLTVLPEKSDSELKYLLVWIVPLQGYSVMDSYKVFVDAQSGVVVKKYSTVVSATGGVGDIIRYNPGLLLAPVALVFLLILGYWWRWRK